VSAVLEDQVTTLRHTLEGARQGQHTQQPVSQQIGTARRIHQDRANLTASPIATFLDEAEEAFLRRNDLVHSSFPAQPDGRLWGHRPNPDRTITDGTADTVDTTVEELREFIRELAALLHRFNQVHSMVNLRSDRGSWRQ
jgi:hypothetical protein